VPSASSGGSALCWVGDFRVNLEHVLRQHGMVYDQPGERMAASVGQAKLTSSHPGLEAGAAPGTFRGWCELHADAFR
jgi:hypothetical protein